MGNSDLIPLGIDVPQAAWLSPQRVAWLAWAFVALGLAARCVRFGLRFPLWEDESFLCFNLMDRGFGDLLQPLVYGQVAPWLFLAIQLASVKLFGFHETALRLFPFVCGVASLFLFRYLAARLLSGLPYLLAIALFAVAYPNIRYSAEAKPYSSDLLVALVLITFTVRWWHRPDETRWLWWLAALAPVMVGLSYPAVFVAGGISLWLAWQFWRGAPSHWRLWAAFNGLLVATFLCCMALSTKGQMDAQLEFMRGCWHANFPPLHEPWKLPGWLLVTHSSDLVAYPIGGPRGGSSATFALLLVGAIVAYRRGWRAMLLLFALPLGLTFIAAALRRYPYGGHVKLNIYMAPAFCMLAGLGGAFFVRWLARWRGAATRATVIGLSLLAMVAVASIARDVAFPYKTPGDDRARAFARWFWDNAAYQGEVACVTADLGQRFTPHLHDQLNWSAEYFCNQRIYSSRHAEGRGVDWSAISAAHPLRCVLYRPTDMPFDEQARQRWLADMKSRYQIVGEERFCFMRHDKQMRFITSADQIEVYAFVPGPQPSTARGPSNSGRR
jgi:hypothetical protein